MQRNMDNILEKSSKLDQMFNQRLDKINIDQIISQKLGQT